MTIEDKLEKFFSSAQFAVVGASTNREKYGNKVLRCYMQHDKNVIPINPRATQIEGIQTVNSILELPKEVQSISIITPPKITDQVVNDAIKHGIKHIWMQPGAESQNAIKVAEDSGLTVLANGICILVVMGYRDAWEPNDQ